MILSMSSTNYLKNVFNKTNDASLVVSPLGQERHLESFGCRGLRLRISLIFTDAYFLLIVALC